MHVYRIQLDNPRCFPTARIDFSRRITLLAGENNSGKTTVIQALNMLQSNVIDAQSIRFGTPEAQVTVFLDDLDSQLMATQVRPWVLNNRVKRAEVAFRLRSDQPLSSMLHPTNLQQLGAMTFTPCPQIQPNNFLVPYLSDRRNTGYSEQVGTQFAFSAGGSHRDLSAKIDRCLTTEDLRESYREACLRVLGFIATSHPSGSGKMGGLEIDSKKQLYVPLARLGSGVGQALGLIVELLVAEGKLFLIEEPENDLHPTALRAVLDLIERSASEGNQFVISTHSNIVLKRLGAIQETRIWQIARIDTGVLPESTVQEVPRDQPQARRALLQSLGYDLSDYDLYDAWLFLEEASAEAVIREFIIPWFAARLNGRLRTHSSRGVTNVATHFRELHQLVLFTHLQPVYRDRAWVLVDGDAAGKEVVGELKKSFSGWPEEHFQCFEQPAFEKYYPPEFDARVQETLALEDKGARREAKETLAADVVEWLRADTKRGKKALEETAKDVIARVREIERVVTGPPASSRTSAH